MPIEQPAHQQPMDKDLLDPILVAQAKVEVLQEEKLRLEAFRDKSYKENARLELVFGHLSADVALLTSKKEECERNLAGVASALSEAESKLDLAGQAARSLAKESSLLRDKIDSDSSKLSDIVVAQREALEVVTIEKDALAAKVAAFEDRKTRVRDLISSI
jgi:hypothetical protein